MTEAEREELERLLDLAEIRARTEWEVEFVADMHEKLADPFWIPTERQWAKVEEIAGAPAPF